MTEIEETGSAASVHQIPYDRNRGLTTNDQNRKKN